MPTVTLGSDYGWCWVGVSSFSLNVASVALFTFSSRAAVTKSQSLRPVLASIRDTMKESSGKSAAIAVVCCIPHKNGKVSSSTVLSLREIHEMHAASGPDKGFAEGRQCPESCKIPKWRVQALSRRTFVVQRHFFVYHQMSPMVTSQGREREGREWIEGRSGIRTRDHLSVSQRHNPSAIPTTLRSEPAGRDQFVFRLYSCCPDSYCAHLAHSTLYGRVLGPFCETEVYSGKMRHTSSANFVKCQLLLLPRGATLLKRLLSAVLVLASYTGWTRSNYHPLHVQSLASTGRRKVGLVAIERGDSKPSELIIKTNLRDESDLPEVKS